MNFKEMCAQKRTEKDRAIVVSHAVRHWLHETLSVLQDLPHIRLLTGGLKTINVLRGPDIICKVKIETGILSTHPLSWKWRLSSTGQSYHVTVSRHEVDESLSFHQIEGGVKGHKKLRETIQFWFAQMVVDNNWDKTI